VLRLPDPADDGIKVCFGHFGFLKVRRGSDGGLVPAADFNHSAF
jgi:hypothetical protein